MDLKVRAVDLMFSFGLLVLSKMFTPLTIPPLPRSIVRY